MTVGRRLVELPAAEDLNGDSVLYVVTDSGDRRTTVDELLALVPEPEPPAPSEPWTPIYGALYKQGSNTTTIGTAGDFFILNTPVTPEATSQGVIVGSGTLTVSDGGEGGVFDVQAVVCVSNGSHDTLALRIMKNSGTLPETESRVTLQSGSGRIAAVPVRGLVQLDEGDSVALAVANLSGTTNVVVETMNLSIVKLVGT